MTLTDTLEKILWIIGGLFGAGGVGHFLSNRKTNDRTIEARAANFYKKEFERVLANNEKLVFEIANLKSSLIIERALKFNAPLPYWKKDINLRMEICNEAYERLFLIPNGTNRMDYIGKKDEEFWYKTLGQEGLKIGAEYNEVDREIILTKKDWNGIETVKIGSTDVTENWYMYKWATIINNECVGVEGIAFPIDKEEICNGIRK